MPRPTLTELAADLQAMAEREVALRRDLTRLEDGQRAGNDELAALRREVAELRQENAILRQRHEDLLKRYELWEARWAFVMALVGAVLSLASGLIVTLTRTQTR